MAKKYDVYISPQAYREIDEIYTYIKEELFAEKAAIDLVDDIESAILGLDELPDRGAERKVGAYANQGYRQLFVKNYTIIYRVEENEERVIVLTVRYSHSDF